MAYENLKNAIKQAIKQNGNQEITGNLLQSTLLNIVNTLGADYKFLGFAMPSTVPPTSEEGRLFYFASEVGEYPNFKRSDESEYVNIGPGVSVITKEANSNFWNANVLVDIVQTTGEAYDSIMSQKAVSDNLSRVIQNASRIPISINNQSAIQSLYIKNGETVCVDVTDISNASNVFVNPYKTGEKYKSLKKGKNYFIAEKDGYIELSNFQSVNGYMYIETPFLYNELNIKYTQCDTTTNNLIIDTHNKTITIEKGFILSIKQVQPINEQTVSYNYNDGYKLYIVYLNKNAELKCVNYDYFTENNNEIKNIQLILCRFTISDGEIRLTNACCSVIIDNTKYSIDSNSKELAAIKKDEMYNEMYIQGYNFIISDKVETWTSMFKVTKLIKVSENLVISNACSASSAANACILYDEAFNIIGTIKGNRTEESIKGTLYVDITYDDIKEATYIQVCEDERNPAKYSNAKFVASELWNNRLSHRINEDDYFVQSPGNSDQYSSYSNVLAMKYDVFEKEIYAVRVNFGIADTDIDIIVLNSITKSYKKIQTIKKEFINSNDEYQTFFLKDPLYMRANMYIGFSKGVRWRTNKTNTLGGAWILSADSTEWQNQKSVVFEFGIYARNVSKNFIGKTFSVMTDSLGTDNYATLPRRVYWRRLQEIAGMTNYTNSIKGGTCIMPGLRDNSSRPFVDENRYAALKENGRTGKDPDIIIIQGGINDFGTTPSDGDVFEKFAEIGTKDDIGKSAETSFYAAYSFLLQKLTETYPNAQLICCTPIKMWAFEGRLKTYYPLTNIHGLKLQDFVDAIIYISGVYGAKVADLYGNFPANEKSWQNYHVDHYHPNDAGYAIITEILLNAILNK